MNNLDAHATIKQRKRPTAVGMANASAVYERLFVSLYTVISDVEQGQWKSAKIAVHTATTGVQPFSTNNAPIADMPTSAPIEVA